MTITSCYILAGGQSHRMGVDKLRLKINGLTLIGRTIQVCKTVFPKIYLVTRDGHSFSELSLPEIRDASIGEGPISGVIASLRHCPDETCFITAADWYGLSALLLTSLMRQYRGENYFGIRDSYGLQPLHGIYQRSILPILEQAVSSGVFSLKEAVGLSRHGWMTLPVGSELKNINTSDDWRCVLERLST